MLNKIIKARGGCESCGNVVRDVVVDGNRVMTTIGCGVNHAITSQELARGCGDYAVTWTVAVAAVLSAIEEATTPDAP